MRKYWLVLPISLLASCSTFLINEGFTYVHAKDRPDSSSEQRIETNSRLIAFPWGVLDDWGRATRIIDDALRGSSGTIDDVVRVLRPVNPKLSSAIRRLKYFDALALAVQNRKLKRVVHTLFRNDSCYGRVTCNILLERGKNSFGEYHKIGLEEDKVLKELIDSGTLNTQDLRTAKDLRSEIEKALKCCELPVKV